MNTSNSTLTPKKVKTDRSLIFTNFNQLRPFTPNRRRLNRALGVAQSNQPRPYTTTAAGCTCNDWKFRGSKTGQPCKHMIGLQLITPAATPAPRRSLAEINDFLFG